VNRIYRRQGAWWESPQELALLEREHDDSAAIVREAAKEGISPESYVRMRTNHEMLHRLVRILKSENKEIESERLRDPPRAARRDAVLQAQINAILDLSPDLDQAPPEPQNRGGAPKGNKNAVKRCAKNNLD
jgi:hypothetical protein